MKRSIFGVLLLGLVSIFGAFGCSNNEDGPSLSDDELLKRGKAGHEAGMQRPAASPATTGTTTSGK